MAGKFRSLSNQVELFLSQGEHSKAKFIVNQKTDIKNHLFRFKKALTGGKYASPAFSYHSAVFSKYEAQYLNFSKKINQLIIDINKK